MGRLRSRLDTMEKQLAKVMPKAGQVVVVRRFCYAPGQQLTGYRDVRTGAVRSLDEATWPPPRAGVVTVVEEVYG